MGWASVRGADAVNPETGLTMRQFGLLTTSPLSLTVVCPLGSVRFPQTGAASPPSTTTCAAACCCRPSTTRPCTCRCVGGRCVTRARMCWGSTPDLYTYGRACMR